MMVIGKWCRLANSLTSVYSSPTLAVRCSLRDWYRPLYICDWSWLDSISISWSVSSSL